MTASATRVPDKALLESILRAALEAGAAFAEVYFEDTAVSSLSLENHQIKEASSHHRRGVGVRCIRDGETGYAYTDILDDTVLRETARTAALAAQSGRAVAPVSLEARRSYDAAQERTPAATVAPATKAARLLEADAAATAYDARVAEIMGSFASSTSTVVIANSEGLHVQDHRPMCRVNFSVIARANGDMRMGTAGGGGRTGFEFFDTYTFTAAALEAARSAVDMLGAAEAPSGPRTVVLAPGWSGVLLHEAVGHGLEADFIRKGTSLYAGKVGQRVASEQCTVIDNGAIPGRRGSLGVDDEGTPARENVLIEKGILRAFMFDRVNADLMKHALTGNGRRETFRHVPMPRMTNTYLAAGTFAPEEILASVKDGLYCRTFGGGQVDISNGNFVFEVREGYLIENGKLTRPVKGATLIGTGPEALQKVTMAGTDAQLDNGVGMCGKNGQGVPVCVGLPTVRMDGITVGGTRGV